MRVRLRSNDIIMQCVHQSLLSVISMQDNKKSRKFFALRTSVGWDLQSKKVNETQIGIAVDEEFVPSRNRCCFVNYKTCHYLYRGPEDALSQVAV